MSNQAGKQYPMCDALMDNPAKHCATLAVTKNVINSEEGWPSFAQPSDELRNGTITFVKSDNITYGITCWHVVEHYRDVLKKSGDKYSHSLRTMVNGFYVVIDRFVRPDHEFGQPELDIVIREFNPDFPPALGKVPIDLDNLPEEPNVINHAYAVGFPENLKYKKFEDDFGFRVSMPQKEILAEIDSFPKQRFSLFSQLSHPPKEIDYSGMSGGPIFWSTENNYGILGIIYESVAGSELLSPNSIHVSAELSTPSVIRRWIKQLKYIV